MKKYCTLFLVVFAMAGLDCRAAKWLTDYQAALQQAAAEDKGILVNFTGSDWCGWCIKLKNEVFNQREFNAFASENLVLLEIDFPRKKSQSPQTKRANQDLARQFGVTGYPTIFILDSKGQKRGKTGYAAGGAKNYVSLLKQVPGVNWRVPQPLDLSPTNPALAADNNSPKTRPVDPLTIKPAEIKYGDLQLKGISGGSQKIALINNKSFVAGESGKVKSGEQSLLVECKEIRDGSVLILVEGEAQPRELTLKK